MTDATSSYLNQPLRTLAEVTRTHREFRIGERVLYRGAWGTEPPKPCTITGIGEKNDRLVYDNDLGHWGYADQYERAKRD